MMLSCSLFLRWIWIAVAVSTLVVMQFFKKMPDFWYDGQQQLRIRPPRKSELLMSAEQQVILQDELLAMAERHRLPTTATSVPPPPSSSLATVAHQEEPLKQQSSQTEETPSDFFRSCLQDVLTSNAGWNKFQSCARMQVAVAKQVEPQPQSQLEYLERMEGAIDSFRELWDGTTAKPADDLSKGDQSPQDQDDEPEYQFNLAKYESSIPQVAYDHLTPPERQQRYRESRLKQRAKRLGLDPTTSTARTGKTPVQPKLPSSSKPQQPALQKTATSNGRNTPPIESSRVRNLRLVLIGDSLTRYMYLSLAFFLRHGLWEPLGTHPSMVLEKDHDSWYRFFNYTTTKLAPHEICDCFRPKQGFLPRLVFENRHYWDAQHNNSVYYIQKFGHSPAHGHLEWEDINQLQEEAIQDSHSLTPNYEPAVWSWNWTELITNHVTHLQPKPTHVVINSGKFVDDHLSQPSTMKALRQALDDAGMIGIYKTTSASQSGGTKGQKVNVTVEQQLCHALHQCLDFSWTRRVAEPFWTDWQHFTEPVYRVMNERLLQDVLHIKTNRKMTNMKQHFVKPHDGERMPLWKQ